MPLARIDLVQGKSAEYRRAVGDIVYEAMVEVLKAPKDDRFPSRHRAPGRCNYRRRKLSWRSTHSRLHFHPIDAQRRSNRRAKESVLQGRG